MDEVGATGLIPAYAGRTLLQAAADTVKRAHPRLRGADLWGFWACFWGVGSSPLTRGGLDALIHGALHVGLIPAYAGRTFRRGIGRPLFGAHPRLRGADGEASNIGDGFTGSSPLTRGGRVCRILRRI